MTHYNLSVVKNRNGKDYWTRIGVMFPNRNSDGFTMTFDALPTPDEKGEIRVVASVPKEQSRSYATPPETKTGGASYDERNPPPSDGPPW